RSTAVCLVESRVRTRPPIGWGNAPSPMSPLITPSPSESTLRPPAGTVTGGPSLRSTVIVPSGPPPLPTALIAISASPLRAITGAGNTGSSFDAGRPWPKIATGQPPEGCGPGGRDSVKVRAFHERGTGSPVRV